MPGMSDEENVTTLRDQALGLAVYLGDERAGRVDIDQLPGLGGAWHALRDAVRGKDDGHAVGHLIQFLDKDGAPGSQVVDHELVVHDLIPDKDRTEGGRVGKGGVNPCSYGGWPDQ